MICCLPACLSRAELRLPVALPKRRITSASVVPLPLYVGTLCCVAVGDVEFCRAESSLLVSAADFL